eukprot:5111693-Karenia_brevis.AAC.1
MLLQWLRAAKTIRAILQESIQIWLAIWIRRIQACAKEVIQSERRAAPVANLLPRLIHHIFWAPQACARRIMIKVTRR